MASRGFVGSLILVMVTVVAAFLAIVGVMVAEHWKGIWQKAVVRKRRE